MGELDYGDEDQDYDQVYIKVPATKTPKVQDYLYGHKPNGEEIRTVHPHIMLLVSYNTCIIRAYYVHNTW